MGGGGPGVLMKRLAHNRRSGAEATSSLASTVAVGFCAPWATTSDKDVPYTPLWRNRTTALRIIRSRGSICDKAPKALPS